MAFKPNYNFQKAERSRAKAQKKQEKLKRLQDETAKRKADRGDEPEGAEPETDLGAEPAKSPDDA
jgi:hypothetical protein